MLKPPHRGKLLCIQISGATACLPIVGLKPGEGRYEVWHSDLAHSVMETPFRRDIVKEICECISMHTLSGSHNCMQKCWGLTRNSTSR
jgi:hypothetical protein